MSENFKLHFDKYNSELTYLLKIKLMNGGISAEGARQLFAGENITGLADRHQIRQIILAEKNQDIGVENDESH
ncbi:MAG: hypothetical protein ABJA66_03535 [Actinomycetota bacterium]